MTPDELVTITKQHVGNRTSSTITDAWYMDRVNDGYSRLGTFQGRVARPGARQPQMRIFRFYELEDELDRTISPPSTNFVANSSGVYSVTGLWDKTNSREIRRRPSRFFKRLDPTLTGEWRYWSPAGRGGVQGYRIWRIPTASTDVREYVYKHPETLTSGGSAPVIPEDWHEAIHLFAGARAAQLLDMPDKAMELLNLAYAFLAERKTPYEEAGAFGGTRYISVGRRS